ncbi:hypothetical protein EV702DRAFT_1189502 [Suillus placidus]|uniref:J domain-containing protein n=1 Tax=Suillus placidus TaxID=48579 RepID=A0A9P6ZHM9_9AGAM|nr:hypothetical protein EV702DRAFT_1189502 [Suillus placidus]
MEGNKDEAIKCLSIAQKYKDAGNLPSARKFCQKSITCSPRLRLQSFLSLSRPRRHLDRLPRQLGQCPSTPNGNAHASSSSTETHHPLLWPSIGACKVTEYYEILSVKKDCGGGRDKEGIQKLALALHPDKNGAPGAVKAFKMVSKAFQVLSDSQKRAIYDQSGSDPESRSGGIVLAQFGGEGEMSPEDLFNMFFGGGGMTMNNGFGGGPFGGPVFTASFGPGGFRTTRMRTNMGGAQAQQQGEGTQAPALILLIAFSFLSAIPDMFSTSIPDPRYSFSPSTRFNVERQTSGLGIKYHVNEHEFKNHRQIAADIAGGAHRRGSALSRFEGQVDQVYTNSLYGDCQRAVDKRQRRRDAEIGLFGVGTDWEKVKAIEAEKIDSCEELKRLGVIKS